MNLSHLRKWLSFIQTGPGDPSSDDDDDDDDDDADCPDFGGRPFVPAKRLCERDYVIIDMLNSQGHEIVSFCVTDPQRPDNPVIYVNHGFEKLTGYGHGDVVGRNCRFLQGPETSEGDRRTIRDAIEREKECSVNLVNYKKDGTKFVNEFFLTQLRTDKKELAYHIGIQVAVSKRGPGQMPSNPGWIYSLGNHV